MENDKCVNEAEETVLIDIISYTYNFSLKGTCVTPSLIDAELKLLVQLQHIATTA